MQHPTLISHIWVFLRYGSALYCVITSTTKQYHGTANPHRKYKCFYEWILHFIHRGQVVDFIIFDWCMMPIKTLKHTRLSTMQLHDLSAVSCHRVSWWSKQDEVGYLGCRASLLHHQESSSESQGQQGPQRSSLAHLHHAGLVNLWGIWLQCLWITIPSVWFPRISNRVSLCTQAYLCWLDDHSTLARAIGCGTKGNPE